MINILLWLTNRPAYRLIKNIRWELEVMDLADALIEELKKEK
jgi:hypothetical protein